MSKFILIIILLIIIINIYDYYYKHIEYYSQIKKYALIPDYTRWVLSDKVVAKNYAELNGFKVPKTYQIVKYPHQINFSYPNCVIKPTDLCDSGGVYLIRNGINLKTNKKINPEKIKLELQYLRSEIYDEYYMTDKMYNGLVPYTGYIVEELLLDDNNQIPVDYKCYVFGGKLYYVAMTYNRRIENNIQKFDSIWFNSEWIPIKTPMIKNGYKYTNSISKPKQFEKMKKLVEDLGNKLQRHCRIDVYLINDDVYLGEMTFFCGAFLHTFYCNLSLGLIWLKNKDNFEYLDDKLLNCVPEFYNKI